MNGRCLKNRLVLGAKLAILVIVGFFLFQALRDAWEQLAIQKFSIHSVRISWLFASAILYLAGLFPMGIFWHKLLIAMGQEPRLADTLRAYYAGHLGKYVPGKAMVVVIRAGMLSGARVSATVTAVSVFAETLTMMAVAAFLAASIIAWRFAHERFFLLSAVGLMAVAGIPTWPPVFRWLVRTLGVSALRIRSMTVRGKTSSDTDSLETGSNASGNFEAALSGYTWNVAIFGWAANLIGWLILGMSLLAVLHGIVGPASLAESGDRYIAALAAVTLSSVAGFLSLLPAGVLVRELVIRVLLAPQFGSGVAIVAAILFRVVSLVAESACATMLYFGNRRSSCRDSSCD